MNNADDKNIPISKLQKSFQLPHYHSNFRVGSCFVSSCLLIFFTPFFVPLKYTLVGVNNWLIRRFRQVNFRLFYVGLWLSLVYQVGHPTIFPHFPLFRERLLARRLTECEVPWRSAPQIKCPVSGRIKVRSKFRTFFDRKKRAENWPHFSELWL